MSVLRWVVVALLVAGVVGLVVWARGTEHHRGQDVGAASSGVGVPAALAG